MPVKYEPETMLAVRRYLMTKPYFVNRSIIHFRGDGACPELKNFVLIKSLVMGPLRNS